MLTGRFSTEVPELKSNQEEADTRLVLHTKPACDSSKQNVLGVSEDTDVIAFLLAIFIIYLMVNYFKKLKLKIVKDF